MASKYRVETTFRGHAVVIDQEPRERTPGGGDNTGWCVWEAANVLLRYVESDGHVNALLAAAAAAAAAAPSEFPGLRLLDLSSGAGLVAVACAAAGARVLATDIPEQLPQLERSVARSGVSGRVTCAPYWWGAPVAGLAPPWSVADSGGCDGVRDWFDLTLVSDILYIALRDRRTAELAATLRAVVAVSSACLFSFEERLPDEEQAFMVALGAGAGGIDVTELAGAAVAVTYESSLRGAGGHADTELWNPALFWEPPPIRMFVLRRPRTAMSQ